MKYDYKNEIFNYICIGGQDHLKKGNELTRTKMKKKKKMMMMVTMKKDKEKEEYRRDNLMIELHGKEWNS